MANNSPGIQKDGSVDIVELKIIGSSGTIIDLKDFLVELNIYEDIFASTVYGDIVLSDSRNIIELLPIIGEEYINVHFKTPSFEKIGAVIKKTFRVYRLTNRKIVRDNNTQIFTLHFASTEMFYDMVLPIYRSLEGNIGELAFDIFELYLKSARNIEIPATDDSFKSDESKSSEIFVSETKNNIKFVSPGWTPLKIINWLATKAIPKEDSKSKDFLFFETTKQFYFTSMEKIFKDANENNNILDTYTYSASNLREDDGSKDLSREIAIANEIEMIESTDYVKNYTNGYLANRLITLDVFNKKYEVTDYDYVDDYKNLYHTAGDGAKTKPLFDVDGERSALSNISFYPVNPRLFQTSKTDYFQDNISENMKFIHGNRRSSLLGLTNVKLNITCPGRTDAEVGRMINFKFPKLGPSSAEDSAKDKLDTAYSGMYLITAIHHRVTPQEHTLVMEIVKDSLSSGDIVSAAQLGSQSFR
jgi:hypothetical protein